MNDPARFTISLLLPVVLAVTWLNPFAPGPSPAVLPWLVSLACGAIALSILLFSSLQCVPKLASISWVVASLASAVIGLAQYFGNGDALSPWVNAVSIGEAFGNLRQRNQFASLTNIGLVALLLWGPPSKTMTSGVARTISIALPAAAGLLMVGNAASSSRTGLLELFAVVSMAVYWGALRHASVRRVIFTALLAYGAASIGLPWLAGFDPGSVGIFARLQDSGPACASRFTLWSNVVHLISLRQWLGWGWGELDYAHFITLYPGTRFCEILDNAHNLPLHLAVELGVPVASFACGCIAWLVWRGKPWRERDSGRQMAWGVLAVTGIHSLLEYPLWYGPFQIALGLCLWILCTPAQSSTSDSMASGESGPVGTTSAVRRSGHGRFALAILPVAALAFAAYAAWDYHRVSQIYLPTDQRSAYYRTHTLDKIRDSRLFQNQVHFAELTTTPLTVDNAARLNAMAHRLMSFSPEARVVVKLIESARILGRDDEAAFFETRFRSAYPEAHQQWLAQQSPDGSSIGHKMP